MVALENIAATCRRGVKERLALDLYRTLAAAAHAERRSTGKASMPWALISVAASFIVFGALTRLSPCNRNQRSVLAKGFVDDVLYWGVSILAYSGLSQWILKATVQAAFGAQAPVVMGRIAGGWGWAHHTPLLAQALIVIVLTDVVQYWLHRAFHTGWLWPFHAIHHSSSEVDWTTTYRVHPVNFVLYNSCVAALVRALGFSPEAFLVIAPFNFVTSALVHANLNWTFGPFRYVLASPVFHRWHHSSDARVRDMNFAPTFPVLDLMFGTFHMPKGELPASYGAEGVPDHFLGQLAWPFRATAERLAGALRPRRAAA
jgi:sterol desaturase/sphingolipid hydroxylase (fatty acid hydroxylase superfamily)